MSESTSNSNNVERFKATVAAAFRQQAQLRVAVVETLGDGDKRDLVSGRLIEDGNRYDRQRALTAKHTDGTHALQLGLFDAPDGVTRASTTAVRLPHPDGKGSVTLAVLLRFVGSCVQTPFGQLDFHRPGSSESVLCATQAYALRAPDGDLARFVIETRASLHSDDHIVRGDGSSSAMLIIFSDGRGTSLRVVGHDEPIVVLEANVHGAACHLVAPAIRAKGPAGVCVVQVPVRVVWANSDNDRRAAMPSSSSRRPYLDGTQRVWRMWRDEDRDILVTQMLLFSIADGRKLPASFGMDVRERISSAAKKVPSVARVS